MLIEKHYCRGNLIVQLFITADTEVDDASEKTQSCKGDGCNDENITDNDDFEEDCSSSIHEQLFAGSERSGMFFC